MIKVLIVDDSAVVRRVLSNELSKAGDIDIVGTAVDPYIARDKLLALRPDVITLDLEMPRMNGLTFLGKIMKYNPLPVIVVSSHTPPGSETVLRALELGAVDVISKPTSPKSLEEISRSLVHKIRSAASARFGKQEARHAPARPTEADAENLVTAGNKVIAMGASTGGTRAIKEVMLGLPANTPGILIVQHMPAYFTACFAKQLDQLCLMEIREAKNNDLVEPGVALVAPGDQHMTLRRNEDRYYVQTRKGPPVYHQRPSADVLFHSVARHAGHDAVGVILTGMGTDGAKGLLAMHEAGAYTLAQDEDSSVVFGMPREAVRLGAVDKVAPSWQMSRYILDAISQRNASHVSRTGMIKA